MSTSVVTVVVAAMMVAMVVAKDAVGAEVIAHRGASADAPENTVAAWRLGFQQGADGGELDIHLTKDGKLAVMHDADTKRTAGVEGKIAEQTLDALKKLNVGTWEKWAGRGFDERVPTLDEALATVPAGKRMYVEIKCKSEALPELEATLKRAKLAPEQTPIITFHFEVAVEAKRRFPAIAVYSLHGYKKDKAGNFPDVMEIARKAKAAGLDGIDVDYKFPLDEATVRAIKGMGLKVYVWTVDDMAKAVELVKAGVDGVTTNRPGELRKALGGR